MTASPPDPKHRPVPTVAIVGNDAVLQAAPATPVQLAHACLRRGFTVAVPASWGDELVAAETVRRLAGRAQGPSVMCVCPFVRSRLLAPGPDLAPFLVSLVAPPVAVARYLRAVYGELAVHITYIGSCPSAGDPAIDASLTPDDFFADIAERGIALSEQPLVFDSIMPPDRRRWCSLPGGVPNSDVLWSEADGRALVEIDRDDVSADLAQHIITREHVLLDLAPSLGCVCSGAIASVPPRGARLAVTALEPPRALAPVIEPATVVVLDAPVGAPPFSTRATIPAMAPNVAPAPSALHREVGPDVLDTVIGKSLVEDPTEAIEPTDVTRRYPADPDAGSPSASPVEPVRIPTSRPEPVYDIAPVPGTNGVVVGGSAVQLKVSPSAHAVDMEDDVPMHLVVDLGGTMTAPSTVIVESDVETLVETTPERIDEGPRGQFTEATHPSSMVREEFPSPRRRTPVATPMRHPAANIPRTAAPDGRLLPRAYVAKRRTPPAGMTALASEPPHPLHAEHGTTPSGGDAPVRGVSSADLTDRATDAQSPARARTGIDASLEYPSLEPPLVNTTATAPVSASSGRSAPEHARRAARAESTTEPARTPSDSAKLPSRRPGPVVFLLLGMLVALSMFVLVALQQ